MKICSRCLTSKELDFFSNIKGSKGKNSWCKKCHLQYIKDHPEPHKKAKIKYHQKKRFKKYGIDANKVNIALIRQKWSCAICNTKFAPLFNIDYCHETGKFRGLLCTYCGLGLRNFKENIISLKNAIEYLQL